MRTLLILVLLILAWPQKADAWGPGDLFQVSAALVAHVFVHESGHYLVAQSVGARNNRLTFLSREAGEFFLGLNTVGEIDEKARLLHIMGGPVAASLTFEVALKKYRVMPTTFNRALLFFSGTEFLWYSIYSFYLVSERDPRLDPVAIADETRLDPAVLVALGALQAALNSYRVLSGQDRFIAYLTLDRESTSFRVGFKF